MDEEFSPEERVLLQRNYAVKWPTEKKGEGAGAKDLRRRFYIGNRAARVQTPLMTQCGFRLRMKEKESRQESLTRVSLSYRN